MRRAFHLLRTLVGVAAVFALFTPRAGAKPILETKDGTAIRAEDAAALTGLLAGVGKNVWLIRVSKAWMVQPPARACEVYLRPGVRNTRLRRGELRRGFDSSQPSGKARWELGGRPLAYAVVPEPTRRFDPARKLPQPGALDGPFTVTGKVADADIIRAVDLVRTGHPVRDLTTFRVPHTETDADGNVQEVIGVIRATGPIDRTLPVSNLTANDANHLEISTSNGNGSGQKIDLQRKAGRWKIAQVWQWNA